MGSDYSISGLSITNIISRVFSGIRYTLPGNEQAGNEITYRALAALSANKESEFSDLGTKVENPVVFTGKTYNKYDGGMIVQVQPDDFVLPYAVTIDFVRSKNVIKTHINGHDGTVKEMFGMDDWQISIKGLILEQNGKTVDDIKQELLMYESLADTIKIKQGKQFTEKGIYGIFIEELSFPQLKGFPKVQPFEISAVSDSLDLWLVE